ncbi:MAG: Flp pilus assembly protein CpaB [Deltaproteobacteria bacterium]|nr:MAG: Flp pilus assembly protein CpaB [Deltaproteobacteria bacterium]
MKKYGTIIALAVAVVFGILAVVLANKWLTTRASRDQVTIREQVPLAQIVIAAKDLEIGSKLTQDNLVLADWPKANVPKGAFTKIEDVVGRVTVTKMVAGKPLVAAELAGEGSGVGLVAQIRPGYRAMAIRVDEVIGVGGFILPSTFVDIIAVDTTSGGKRDADTILERVPVLAVAQETFVEEGKAKLVKTVTMELTPRNAEKLAAQINQGPIHLVLRNPADLGAPEEPEEKPVVRKVRRPAVQADTQKGGGFTIEVIQGDKQPQKYNF